MNINFDVGDMVQLKSGGPIMTIDAVGVGYERNRVSCIWFDEKNIPVAKSFIPATLKRVEDPKLSEMACVL